MPAPLFNARWADRHLIEFSERIARLNVSFPRVLPQEINKVGSKVKTQIIRTLRQQTGLKRDVIVKAIGRPRRAYPGHLSYEMVTRGGFIRLKYLSPRETKTGVVARPFGKRKLYPGTFMKGGAFPNRKDVPYFKGHVWRRIGSGRDKITQVRSGVRIPDEMVSGITLERFEQIAAPMLRKRIEVVLNKLVP